MKWILFILLSIDILFAYVGKVSALVGDAFIIRGKKSIPIKNGMTIDSKDIIKTKNAKLQIIFKDRTIITIGKNSTFNIEDYVFDNTNPPTARFRLSTGIMKTITGKIGKIAPARFRIRTKNASIGIRGTIFIVEVKNDITKVSMLEGITAFTDLATTKSFNVKAGEQIILNPKSPQRIKIEKHFSVPVLETTKPTKSKEKEKAKSSSTSGAKTTTTKQAKETKNEKKEVIKKVATNNQQKSKSQPLIPIANKVTKNNEEEKKETPTISTNQQPQQTTEISSTQTNDVTKNNEELNELPTTTTSTETIPETIDNSTPTTPTNVETNDLVNSTNLNTNPVNNLDDTNIEDKINETENVDSIVENTQNSDETSQEENENPEDSISDTDEVKNITLLSNSTYKVSLGYTTKGDTITEPWIKSELPETSNDKIEEFINKDIIAQYSGIIIAIYQNKNSEGQIDFEFNFGKSEWNANLKFGIEKEWKFSASGEITTASFSSSKIETDESSDIKNISGNIEGVLRGDNADILTGNGDLSSDDGDAKISFGAIQRDNGILELPPKPPLIPNPLEMPPKPPQLP